MKPNTKEKIHILWKQVLILLGIFLVLHFLKDITQDVLKIQTPLDYMGDIKEDASSLPSWLQAIYFALWILATIVQPLMVYFIFKTWKHNTFNRNDKIIVYLLCYFLAMMIWAFTLTL